MNLHAGLAVYGSGGSGAPGPVHACLWPGRNALWDAKLFTFLDMRAVRVLHPASSGLLFCSPVFEDAKPAGRLLERPRLSDRCNDGTGFTESD
jgi:hypothetical protein